MPLCYIGRNRLCIVRNWIWRRFLQSRSFECCKNTVGDIADLANVKHLSDQVVTRGGANLGFEEYLELLLSACSTYDKTHATPRSGQQNVYATSVEHDDNFVDA
jgi:hypothetical protein